VLPDDIVISRNITNCHFLSGLLHFFREHIYLIAFRYFCIRTAVHDLDCCKTRDNVVCSTFCDKNGAFSLGDGGDAMGRGISRRVRILKSLLWDPAGYNKDLHGRYRISFRVTERRGELKNPARLQQQVVRSGHSIRPFRCPIYSILNSKFMR